MKKIGVSACFMYPDMDRTVFGPKTLSYLEQDMATYLYRFGAFPVLIPDLPGAALESFLNSCDGFVFQGGTDIAPLTYGEQPLPNSKWPGDPYRDDYELKVLDFAMKNDKPVLGICRGFQLMNVYFGGSLYQDIDTQVDTVVSHRDALLYDQVKHSVEFIKGELLHELHITEDASSVNSVHHQGIKQLGDNLLVTAVSQEDQLVEAFHWTQTTPGRVMGVQWHPEFFKNHPEGLIDADLVYKHFLTFC